jgi:hypothetical protein
MPIGLGTSLSCMLAACVVSKVDAYALPQVDLQQVYQVAPLDSALWGDLQFQEAAGAMRNALKLRGFNVASDPQQKPDVVVLTEFGVGAPRTVSRTTSSSVYGFVDRPNGTATIKPAPGMLPGTFKVEQPTMKSYEQVGTETHTLSDTVYERHLTMVAYDYKAYQERHEQRQIWKVTVVSDGTSGDMRDVLPSLVAAAQPYLGKSTGKQVNVTLGKNSPEVESVRTGVAPPPKRR